MSSKCVSSSVEIMDSLKDVLTYIDNTERKDFMAQYGDDADFQDGEELSDWLTRIRSFPDVEGHHPTSHSWFKIQVVWNAVNVNALQVDTTLTKEG